MPEFTGRICEENNSYQPVSVLITKMYILDITKGCFTQVTFEINARFAISYSKPTS